MRHALVNLANVTLPLHALLGAFVGHRLAAGHRCRAHGVLGVTVMVALVASTVYESLRKNRR